MISVGSYFITLSLFWMVSNSILILFEIINFSVFFSICLLCFFLSLADFLFLLIFLLSLFCTSPSGSVCLCYPLCLSVSFPLSPFLSVCHTTWSDQYLNSIVALPCLSMLLHSISISLSLSNSHFLFSYCIFFGTRSSFPPLSRPRLAQGPFNLLFISRTL